MPRNTSDEMTETGRSRAEAATNGPHRMSFHPLTLLSNVKKQFQDDNVMVVSAGIAFFFFLALVPALGATVAIYGAVADPADVFDLIQRLSETLPGGDQNLIIGQLRDAVDSPSSTPGWGAAVGILFAMWSASTGTTRLITALNIAYGKDARSGVVEKRGVGLVLTVSLIGAVVAGIYLGTNTLSLINQAGFAQWLAALANAVFWLGAAAYMATLLSLIYRYAPNRDEPAWHGITWGSVVGVLLAITATVALRLYVSNFNNLSEAYGSLTTVIVALLYLWIVALAIVVGAEFDSQLQRHR